MSRTDLRQIQEVGVAWDAWLFGRGMFKQEMESLGTKWSLDFSQDNLYFK